LTRPGSKFPGQKILTRTHHYPEAYSTVNHVYTWCYTMKEYIVHVLHGILHLLKSIGICIVFTTWSKRLWDLLYETTIWVYNFAFLMIGILNFYLFSIHDLAQHPCRLVVLEKQMSGLLLRYWLCTHIYRQRWSVIILNCGNWLRIRGVVGWLVWNLGLAAPSGNLWPQIATKKNKRNFPSEKKSFFMTEHC